MAGIGHTDHLFDRKDVLQPIPLDMEAALSRRFIIPVQTDEAISLPGLPPSDQFDFMHILLDILGVTW